jgi:hypothetical protein
MDDDDDESVDNDENIDVNSYTNNGYQYDSSYYHYHLYTSVFFDECEEVQLNRMDQVNQRLSSTRRRNYQSSYYLSLRGYRSSYYCFGTCSAKFSLEIDPAMMSMYPHDRIVAYSNMFRCSQDATVLQQLSVLQIIQKIRMTPDPDNVVIILKTFWIRLVQRTWKRVYRERRRVIQLRCSRQCHRHVELTGRYIEGAQYLPELRGMLCTY